ncbi:hypothetical protein ABIF60_002696 [Bradyrhizobium japonicum]
MRALCHRQIGRRPLIGRDHLLQAGQNAEQRIRGARKIVHAEVPTASRRDDGGRDDISANRLEQQTDALVEQPGPPHRVLRIHDGLGVEDIRIEPGEVTGIIGGCVRRAGDEEGLGHRKGAVHRVPVKVLDGRQRMVRLSQESITEKIDRLEGVGEKGCGHALVKSVSAI